MLLSLTVQASGTYADGGDNARANRERTIQTENVKDLHQGDKWDDSPAPSYKSR
jgi:hypothetical protein